MGHICCWVRVGGVEMLILLSYKDIQRNLEKYCTYNDTTYPTFSVVQDHSAEISKSSLGKIKLISSNLTVIAKSKIFKEKF